MAALEGVAQFRIQTSALARFRTVLLLAVCALASDLPASVSEIAKLNWPTVGGAIPILAPIWVPLLLVVIWFNGIHDGAGRHVLRLSGPILWLLSLIAVVGGLEFLHAVLSDRMPDPELILKFAWICLVWVALHSFASSDDYLPLLVAGFALFSAMIALFMAAYPADSLLATGPARFFQTGERPDVSVVNSVAYQFALAALLSFSALVLRSSPTLPPWAWAGLWFINCLGVAATKSRGGWLVLAGGMAAILVLRLSSSTAFSLRTKIAAAAFVLSAAAILLASAPQAMSRIEAVMTLGRGIGEEARQNGEIQWADTSLAIRLNMSLKALAQFAESPWIGNGSDNAGALRTHGHLVHGVPLRLLMAYGLFGILIAAGLLVSLWRSGRSFRPDSVLATVVLVAATMATRNAPLYLAAMLAIAAGRPSRTLLR
jgi:O-antigen ligase